MTTIVESSPANAESYGSAIGPGVEVVASVDLLQRHLEERPREYAAVLGPNVPLESAVSLAATLRVTRPALSIILLRHRIDTPVLTEALRSGMREVVEDRDRTGLGQAVRRAYALSEALSGHDTTAPAGAPAGKLITVFSAKGGVGKTTVSTNLAVLLAEGRNSVCLVDLDLAFGDVAVSLQILPTRTIADAVSMGHDIDPAGLGSLLTTYKEGLMTLVAPLQPDAKDAISAELVGRILAMLKQQFDYVVVDTAPAFDDHVLMAFDHSDLLLLLLTLDVPALKATKITIETLDLLNFPRNRVRLVLNRADPKLGLSVAEVEQALQSTVTISIPSAREVPASTNRGEPISTALPRHAVTQCLQTLANVCTESTHTSSALDEGAVVSAVGQRERGRFSRRSRAR